MADDKKLFDWNGKEFDDSTTIAMAIFGFPIGFTILFSIGSIFGIVGVSVALWFGVIASLGIIIDAPFNRMGRIFQATYSAIIFWIISDFALWSNWGTSTQSNAAFWIILVVGNITAIVKAPHGPLLPYRHSPPVIVPQYQPQMQQQQYQPQVQQQIQQTQYYSASTPSQNLSSQSSQVSTNIIAKKYCQNCGEENSSTYCSECGVKVE